MPKVVKKDTKKPPPAKTKSETSNIDELTRKAIEEINRDAKISKIKVDNFGTYKKCPLIKTNKRFLTRTIATVVTHNKRQLDKVKEKSVYKLKDLDRTKKLRDSTKKFGDRKHEYRKPEKKKDD